MLHFEFSKVRFLRDDMKSFSITDFEIEPPANKVTLQIAKGITAYEKYDSFTELQARMKEINMQLNKISGDY